MTGVCTRCVYRNLTCDQQRIFRVLLSAYPDRLGAEDLSTRLGLAHAVIKVQISQMRRRLVGWRIPPDNKRRGYRLIKLVPERFYRPGGLRGQAGGKTNQRGC